MASRRARTLVVRAAALACAALAVVLVARPLGPDATKTTNNLIELAIPLFAAAPLCAIAAHAAGTGRRRWTWALLAAGALTWGVGQAIWSSYEAVGENPFPSLADAGFLGAIPFLVVGIARFPARLQRMTRARVVVDALIVGLAVLFLAGGTVLDDIWAAGEGSSIEQGLLLAYPLADVVLVVTAIAIVARRPDGLRGPLGLLLAGGCCLAVADTSFAWLSSVSDHVDPITDLGWPVGFLLVALAAHRDIDAPDAPTRTDADDDAAARGMTMVEALVLQAPVAAAGVLLAVHELTEGDGDGGIGPFLGVVGGLILALAVVRQAFAQLENAALTRSLRHTVVELRQREDELEHQAFHDPLTGLANRALFRDRLEHASARRAGPDVSVLFVDLDDFKTVNDTMGHDVGDQLLLLVAERLRACTRPGDTVARLGGDEFAVLVEDDAPAAGTALGRRILSALEVPFSVGGRQLRARASVGVVTAERGVAADQLLQDADLAMYAAKAAGGSCVEPFDPAMRIDARERLDLLGDLDGALERGELELFHQPVVRLTGGAVGDVAGHEVLLRWRHPTRGLLTPAAFLDLAEEAGHLLPIGWWVLEEACRGLVGRSPSAMVSVNVSTRQLHEPDAVERVAGALARSGLESHRLHLEVTERALTEGDDVVARLAGIRALGVRIAIDDFGTGYSSLAALIGLPLDVLKIDGSFVRRLDTVEGDLLVQTVVDLAGALGLRTVAEGIEERWQLDRILALGCDAAQGFLLGRPTAVPASERATFSTIG